MLFGLYYSLLQTVVEACQKKRHCKFLASPKTFGGDPCPGLRKFVEVAYKCRPYEFRSKIACENDVIQLICNPYSRIAIYSANYGRTEYESLQCAQPQGVKEEMPRKVLKDRFEAAPEPDEPLQSDLEQDQDELYDEDQFFRESDAAPPGPAPKLQGGPTNGRVSDVPIYIGTSSSTVASPPRSIHDLMDDDDFSFGGRSIRIGSKKGVTSRVENHANQQNPIVFPEIRNEPNSPARIPTDKKLVNFSTPSEVIVNHERTAYNSTVQIPGVSERNDFMNGFDPNGESDNTHRSVQKPSSSDRNDYPVLFAWWEIRQYLKQNQEKFYLYLIVAVTVAILLCVLIVIGRLLVQRRRTTKDGDDKFQTSNTGETTLPNGFTDDISEIDADIDLQTPLPVPSVSRSDSYGPYTPSPGPYGNLGPSNISHTSTTMLVPPCSMGAIMSTSQPPGYLSGPINIMPSQLGSSIDFYAVQPALIATSGPPGSGTTVQSHTVAAQHQQHPSQLSTTSSCTSSSHSSQQQQQPPPQQQHHPQSILKNKEPTISELEDTIVMCPPNRTYCF
uniref:SUEL-type lectin domain-containing protein n=1 Tax=Anopheles culicifacies TaxID=139723 RepID=A0A182M9Y8_9DIPT